jgi:hypothetical protein
MSSSPQPKKWWKTTWAIVVAVGVIIGICSGSLYLFETFNAGATSASTSATATAAQLAQGTAISSPTTTPRPPAVITENRQLQCFDGGTCFTVAVTLDTITIRRSQGIMDWKFTITNTSSGGQSVQLYQVYLEDPATNKWAATGQILQTFDMASGQSEDATGTFRLIPTPDTPYTLHGSLAGGGPFADQTFTFSREQTT